LQSVVGHHDVGAFKDLPLVDLDLDHDAGAGEFVAPRYRRPGPAAEADHDLRKAVVPKGGSDAVNALETDFGEVVPYHRAEGNADPRPRRCFARRADAVDFDAPRQGAEEPQR